MTHGPLPVSPGANCTLVWDGENRLIEVLDGTGSSATSIVKYTYDASSRRISRSVPESPTTLYLYDGFNCIAEYSKTDTAAPALSRTHTWGLDLSGTLQGAGGVGGLLAVTIGGNRYYPTFDGNGNVSEYLTTSGVVATHFEYDPFGNLTYLSEQSPGLAALFDYRFSTKPVDPVTGWFYYLYRYYDPVTGRWPSRDPIEERGGLNLYGFVNNDGVNYIDLLGLRILSEMYECECSVTVPVTNLSEKDENGERCSTCPDNISGNGKGQSAELNAAKNLALHRAEVNMYEVPLEEECHPDGFNLNTKCRCWRNRHYEGDDRGERLEVDPETGKVLPPQSIS